MADRHSRVVILAEDRRQANFVRHYLIARGTPGGRIRQLFAASGRGGDGKAFVRRRYPEEVVELRRLQGRLTTALVAVMDADSSTVQERQQELERALAQEGYPKRGANEPIALVVARREIETWVCALLGRTGITEAGDYKRQVNDQDIRPAAQAYLVFCRQGQASSIPSMSVGCRELDRL